MRIFELRKELLAYFIGHKFELTGRLNNMTWLSTLAYFADMFGSARKTSQHIANKR